MRHSKITIPVAPWDIPDISGDLTEKSGVSPILQAKTRPKDAKKQEESVFAMANNKIVEALIGRTFMGRLNVSDLDYMAKAILQMSDEMHELRERIRRLEAGKE